MKSLLKVLLVLCVSTVSYGASVFNPSAGGTTGALTNETDTIQTVVNRGAVATNRGVQFGGLFLDPANGPGAVIRPSLASGGMRLLDNYTNNGLTLTDSTRFLHDTAGATILDFSDDVEIRTNLTVLGNTTNTGSITAGGGFFGSGAGLTNITREPFEPWTATLSPAASLGTTLVSYANGSLPLLVCTGAQTVGVNPAGGWGGSNGVNRFVLGLWIGSYSVTIQSNATTRWGNALTLSTTETNSLLFRSVGTNNWVIYGRL